MSHGKIGHPKTPDRLYAESLGLTGLYGARIIQRLGGEKRLKAMSEEARSLMLSYLRLPVNEESSRSE